MVPFLLFATLCNVFVSVRNGDRRSRKSLLQSHLDTLLDKVDKSQESKKASLFFCFFFENVLQIKIQYIS